MNKEFTEDKQYANGTHTDSRGGSLLDAGLLDWPALKEAGLLDKTPMKNPVGKIMGSKPSRIRLWPSEIRPYFATGRAHPYSISADEISRRYGPVSRKTVQYTALIWGSRESGHTLADHTEPQNQPEAQKARDTGVNALIDGMGARLCDCKREREHDIYLIDRAGTFQACALSSGHVNAAARPPSEESTGKRKSPLSRASGSCVVRAPGTPVPVEAEWGAARRWDLLVARVRRYDQIPVTHISLSTPTNSYSAPWLPYGMPELGNYDTSGQWPHHPPAGDLTRRKKMLGPLDTVKRVKCSVNVFPTHQKNTQLFQPLLSLMLSRRATPDATGKTFWDRLPPWTTRISPTMSSESPSRLMRPTGTATSASTACQCQWGWTEKRITSAAEGTHLAAYPLKQQSMPFDDEGLASYRQLLAVRVPRESPESMHIAFNNTLAVVDGVRRADEQIELDGNQCWDLNETLRHSGGDGTQTPDIIMLRLPRSMAYMPKQDDGPNATTRQKTPSASPRKRVTKIGGPRSQQPMDEDDAIGEPEEVTEAKPVVERRIGDMYPPRLLDEYQGPLLQLKEAKLVQRDLRDQDGSLIAPTEVYHMQVEHLKILDHGDGPPFTYHPPALLNPLRPSPAKRGHNSAADSAFEITPKSPKKKGRRTTGSS
ncbi:hypothetical protein C8F01DRAFT_1238736 [Mycena amicta]|nr:hypothetical protein C8F01DRAFT_1238736 [Mycena amicta]